MHEDIKVSLPYAMAVDDLDTQHRKALFDELHRTYEQLSVVLNHVSVMLAVLENILPVEDLRESHDESERDN